MEINEDLLIKKAVAPRVTLEALEANIVAEHYFTAYEGRMGSIVEGTYETQGSQAGTDIDLESIKLLTFCVLVLKNGYTVHGVSGCASPENFNREIGMSIARNNAVNQIWPLMGYELKTKLMHQEAIAQDDAMGLALTSLVQTSMGKLEMKPEYAKILLDEMIPQTVESNESVAKIVQAGIKAWAELNGDENIPEWHELSQSDKDIWAATVSYYRANPEPEEDEAFDQKLIRSLVLASSNPPTLPASQRRTHLKLVD